MKISVVTSRYGISGVPLAQLRFARSLASKGHTVDYIIGYVNEGNKQPVEDGVNVIDLHKSRVIKIIFPLIKYLRSEQPDIVFTAGDHLNIVVVLSVMLSGVKTKVSASSRVTPYDTYSNTLFSKRWILKQLSRLTMSKFSALTCVSKDMVKQYQNVFNNPPHVCVYNIVNDAPSQAKLIEDVTDDWFVNKTCPVIVAAGMLEVWKGFNDLIIAVSEILKSRRLKLVIFGEGSMRQELQGKIDELGIESSVKLYGHVSNPLKYFNNADVFVLSSYVEGLPNVLVEAMMCGCTPVSTNCPTGPSEVLQDGKYGYLVPMHDPISMADAINEALDSPINKKLLDEAVEPFSEHAVINRHFKVLGLPISG